MANFVCHTSAQNSHAFLEKGWAQLITDNDTEALKNFGKAYETASRENNTEDKANALLYMGICTYGNSMTDGLHYATKAMDEFNKLEPSAPEKAKVGRCKCLQLFATIYTRQQKYEESIQLSREALSGFVNNDADTTYLGIIYNSLGYAFAKINRKDSSEFYHRKALSVRLAKKDMVYLPGSYISVANIEAEKGNRSQSQSYYLRAISIADSTHNKQAQVASLLGYGNWLVNFDGNEKLAESYYLKAKDIAKNLSDKMFYIRSLERLIELKKKQNKASEASELQSEMAAMKDTLYSWEKDKMEERLQVQFEVSEIDRKLKLEQSEHQVTRLTNYLLGGTILFLILISIGIILFLQRINKRDKQLLQTKETLMEVVEEQKRLKEKQMQSELEFKETQLSALTLQMLQKNELLQELKGKLDGEKNSDVQKIIHRGLTQDKEWTDFNTQFESVNKNFYTRLKQEYPDISPNDLKICALIKLNLSIKEMAGILNISPDSVKTARYRLRKKLQLNTEDNLTDFIMNL